MGYSARCYAQDGATGRVGGVLDAIIQAAQALPYDTVNAAIAYATKRGVELLNENLVTTGWAAASKRFLVSIDFGVTEPTALTSLDSLPNTEVRVPNGLRVLARKHLIPPTTFHAKAYMFGVHHKQVPLAVVAGSANMTVSALVTGGEVVTVQTWNDVLTPDDLSHVAEAQQLIKWFEDAWELADPIETVL